MTTTTPKPDLIAVLNALADEWRRLGEEPPQTEFQTAYRAGLRKCADELGWALRGSEA